MGKLLEGLLPEGLDDNVVEEHGLLELLKVEHAVPVQVRLFEAPVHHLLDLLVPNISKALCGGRGRQGRKGDWAESEQKRAKGEQSVRKRVQYVLRQSTGGNAQRSGRRP